MELRNIPKTNLEVSPICLGTMTFGTPVAEADAIQLTQWAIDHGVNFIDTANMYEGYARRAGSTGGVAEKILGKALKGRRAEAVVATKAGMKVGDAPEDDGTSAAAIRVQLDRSLQRLQTDYIDLYYLHRPDPDSDTAETLGALNEAMQEGKIRYYAVSNYTCQQLGELLRIADENHLPRPVVIQPFFNLLNPESTLSFPYPGLDEMTFRVQDELLPLCEREQIGVVPYRILQSGLLTGKYQRGAAPPVGSRAEERPQWLSPDIPDELFDQLEEIEQQAQDAGLTMTQYAIRWVLEQPAVVSAIVGVKRAEQLADAISAVS